MKVSEAMTHEVRVCQRTESLSRAAKIMWEQDCGCVPVVSGQGELLGVITDRDVCMAAYHEGGRLDQVPVGQAMSKALFTCVDSDDLKIPQELMRKHRVRRLPVVDKVGKLVGLLSLADLVRSVAAVKPAASSTSLAKQLIATMGEITQTHCELPQVKPNSPATKPAATKPAATKVAKPRAAKPKAVAPLAAPPKTTGTKATSTKPKTTKAEPGQEA